MSEPTCQKCVQDYRCPLAEVRSQRDALATINVGLQLELHTWKELAGNLADERDELACQLAEVIQKSPTAFRSN